MLTFNSLRLVGAARVLRWHPGGYDDWSVADWLTALVGEIGEAGNVIKKLNRERDNIVGNDKLPEELRAQLGAELADSAIYLDCFAARCRVLLDEQVVRALHFNEGARNVTWLDLRRWNRHRVGSAFEAWSYSAAFIDLVRDVGRLAEAVMSDDPSAIRDQITATLLSLDLVAARCDVDLSVAIVDKFNAVSERNGFPERLDISAGGEVVAATTV